MKKISLITLVVFTMLGTSCSTYMCPTYAKQGQQIPKQVQDETCFDDSEVRS